MPKARLVSENKHTVGSSALLVCHAHTHTHENTFNDQLVQICPRLDTENKRTVLCKETQQIYEKYCLLKALSNTLSTGWYNNGLALEVATKRVLEAWLFTRQTSTDEENSKEDWAVVLESWNGSRRLATRFQGIPSWPCWYYQFPRKRLGGPRGLVFSPGMEGGWS